MAHAIAHGLAGLCKGGRIVTTNAAPVNGADIRRTAREGLGYRHLRPGQQAVIEAVLAGRDTLAVMPTGFGKSAIYQIAGALLDGATVVVSPLIALQADQLTALEEQAIGEAAAVNSTVPETERQDVLDELDGRRLEFIFLAPEQFNNEEVMARLQDAQPSLFVVDEAHCISEWGHDFRPDYLKLGAVIAALGHPTVLALTATASAPVRREITERLGMRDPAILVRGFDRPNIWLGVDIFADETAKQRALVSRVQAADKPGIIYAATRHGTEELVAKLQEAGVSAAYYHAGMAAKARQQVQQAFMDDEIEVIVATIAFGMGIDKPNVRFVYHHDISESLDAYVQEMGRAGRDGESAVARLFFVPADLGLRRFFASSGRIEPEQVRQVLDILTAAADRGGHPAALTVAELQEQVDLSEVRVLAILNRLRDVGALAPRADGVLALNDGARLDVDAIMAEAVEAQEQRRQYERSRVEMIRGYAELTTCRRQHLLSYFGETLAEPCGNCDNCEARATSATDAAAGGATEAHRPFVLHGRVTHRQWGQGEVLRYEGDTMIVLFDQVGYKTLSVPVVVEQGLLTTL